MTDRPMADSVPRDAPGVREIGFSIPERSNACAILFEGHGDHPRVVHFPGAQLD